MDRQVSRANRLSWPNLKPSNPSLPCIRTAFIYEQCPTKGGGCITVSVPYDRWPGLGLVLPNDT